MRKFVAVFLFLLLPFFAVAQKEFKLAGTTSTATTSLCCANNVAIDKPTYPVPATAIFIVYFSGYLIIMQPFRYSHWTPQVWNSYLAIVG